MLSLGPWCPFVGWRSCPTAELAVTVPMGRERDWPQPAPWTPPWPSSAGSLPGLCSSEARAGGCQAEASILLRPSPPSPALLHQVEREHEELN